MRLDHLLSKDYVRPCVVSEWMQCFWGCLGLNQAMCVMAGCVLVVVVVMAFCGLWVSNMLSGFWMLCQLLHLRVPGRFGLVCVGCWCGGCELYSGCEHLMPARI